MLTIAYSKLLSAYSRETAVNQVLGKCVLLASAGEEQYRTVGEEEHCVAFRGNQKNEALFMDVL